MEVCDILTDPTDPMFEVFFPELKPGRLELLKDFSVMEDHMKRIRNHPAIQAWREKRPSNEEERGFYVEMLKRMNSS